MENKPIPFSHFVITQFNLRNFPLSNNDGYETWVQWTRNRIVLFKEYCLPSMLNQSCKAFKWLLYFDKDTPEEFKALIELLQSYDFIEICYSEGFEDFEQHYIQEVINRKDPSKEWVMTSRIDNDDCLHRDAIKVIQANFVPKQRYLISLASGYTLDIERKTLSHYYYPMSPFISLIELANEPMKGIFSKLHTRWDSLRLWMYKEIGLQYFNRKDRQSRFILKQALWLQTVHGKNVSNSFYRGLPILRSKSLKDFALNFSTQPLPISSISKYYDYVIWKRYFKSLVVRILVNK